MKKYIKYLLPFLLFWIVLTEKFNLEVFITGLVLCALIYFVSKKLSLINIRKGYHIVKRLLYVLIYLITLIKEIVIANFQVARIVLSRQINLTPETVRFNTKLNSELSKVILANSITLTPGTLTVSLEKNKFIVHCLDKAYTQDILNSKFEKILLKIEE